MPVGSTGNRPSELLLLNDQRLRAALAQVLQWHGAEAQVGQEAFRTWVLTTLKGVLPYDGAIWGLLPQGGSSNDGICGARMHGLSQTALQGFVQARRAEFAASLRSGRASNVCVGDPEWQGAEHAPMLAHARLNGLENSLFFQFASPASPGHQFMLLSRRGVGQRFDAEDVAAFELMAPHMMQAYATRRRLFLDKPREESSRLALAAAAVVDRAGHVHDQHERFRAVFQREWSDWRGDRLPPPLLELAARHVGTRWRFLGEQIAADFIPVDDSYVVSARSRYPGDELTEREHEVARRYAAGGNFREVAESLSLAPATVRSHLRSVFGKLQIRNKAQLADLLR